MDWASMKHTSLLSFVSRTATPASTLPTVNEINMAIIVNSIVQRS